MQSGPDLMLVMTLVMMMVMTIIMMIGKGNDETTMGMMCKLWLLREVVLRQYW